MIHGGYVYENEIEFDYSINTGIMGCPLEIKDTIKTMINQIEQYPDIDYMSLRKALSEYEGIDESNIICGNGASELIMALVNYIKPKRALLIAPSFYGYLHCLKAVGCQIDYYHADNEKNYVITEDILRKLNDIDLLILCNPNNPTGRAIDEETLLKIFRTCIQMKIHLVIDECFIDLCKGHKTFVNHIYEYERLYILKAFTKSLSIPGIRLGYLLSQKVNDVKAYLPEWNVSVIATQAGIIGARILKEGKFLEDSENMIEAEKQYLLNEIKKLGIVVYPSEANFLLLYSEINLYDVLLEKKILVRDCSNFEGLKKGYYRIAVKDHEANKSFIKRLKEVVS